MGAGKDIVITTYGHNTTIDKIAASTFDTPDGQYRYSYYSDAVTYCDALNKLELNGNAWVFAKIISQNTPYSLDSFLPLKFDIFLELDDKTIQRILRKVPSQTIAKALKSEEAVSKRVFSNMSKRASVMLLEDMEYMGPVRHIDVKESQEKILDIIRHLEYCGEIIIPFSKGEKNEPR